MRGSGATPEAYATVMVAFFVSSGRRKYEKPH